MRKIEPGLRNLPQVCYTDVPLDNVFPDCPAFDPHGLILQARHLRHHQFLCFVPVSLGLELWGFVDLEVGSFYYLVVCNPWKLTLWAAVACSVQRIQTGNRNSPNHFQMNQLAFSFILLTVSNGILHNLSGHTVAPDHFFL